MSTASEARLAGRRDPRLDFFRGVGMLIILTAHISGNSWADLIPARFGFSDATEIFVFCSGMASAIAFGRVFSEQGWAVGAARIMHRVWQVYWAHIAVFLTIAAMMIVTDQMLGGDRYINMELNLAPFFAEPKPHLAGLMTLTYVPNYFDILPMYLVILALVPVVMAIARFGPPAVGFFVVALWAIAATGALNLPAEPTSQRMWFFNPFSWQLVFFTGFAFVRGWLKPPPVDRRLIVVSIAILALAAPVSCHYGYRCFAGYGSVPLFGDIHQALAPLIDKTHFGILRFVHFLALAYLAYVAAGEGGRRLSGAGVDIIRLVGQQTLAVFLAGLVTAQLLGVVLDRVGRTELSMALANLGGFAVLIAVAVMVSWFKSPPWKKPLPKPVRHADGASGDTASRMAQAPILSGRQI